MKVTDNVFLLEATRGSYCYIIQAEETVLIDTGLPLRGKGILRAIQALGTQPNELKHILLTHHDVDHIGNAAMLERATGAQIWASKEDIPYILGEKDRHGFKRHFKYIFRVANPKDIKPFPDEDICGIQVVPTPGHTPGHVCFLYRDVLFVGDLLENKKGTLRSYPYKWNWNNELMQESIKEIVDLPYKWICPAHGRPILRG